MSRYTITFDEISRDALESGVLKSSKLKDRVEYIRNLIFKDFDYTFVDDIIKREVETKFVKYYFTRELINRDVEEFKRYLEIDVDMYHEMYAKMYESFMTLDMYKNTRKETITKDTNIKINSKDIRSVNYDKETNVLTISKSNNKDDKSINLDKYSSIDKSKILEELNKLDKSSNKKGIVSNDMEYDSKKSLSGFDKDETIYGSKNVVKSKSDNKSSSTNNVNEDSNANSTTSHTGKDNVISNMDNTSNTKNTGTITDDSKGSNNVKNTGTNTSTDRLGSQKEETTGAEYGSFGDNGSGSQSSLVYKNNYTNTNNLNLNTNENTTNTQKNTNTLNTNENTTNKSKDNTETIYGSIDSNVSNSKNNVVDSRNSDEKLSSEGTDEKTGKDTFVKSKGTTESKTGNDKNTRDTDETTTDSGSTSKNIKDNDNSEEVTEQIEKLIAQSVYESNNDTKDGTKSETLDNLTKELSKLKEEVIVKEYIGFDIPSSNQYIKLKDALNNVILEYIEALSSNFSFLL